MLLVRYLVTVVVRLTSKFNEQLTAQRNDRERKRGEGGWREDTRKTEKETKESVSGVCAQWEPGG